MRLVSVAVILGLSGLANPPQSGPRQNETHRFRYESAAQPGLFFHCMVCPKRDDSTYKDMQVPSCLKNYQKEFPTLYEWETPGCSDPPYIPNIDWKCERGSSGELHKVYLLCQGWCNITGEVQYQLYCNPSLNWEITCVNEDSKCEGFVLTVNGDAGVAFLSVIIVTVILCIYCKRKKPRKRQQQGPNVDSSTSHSEVYRGGDGGVDPSPQSGLSPGVTSPSSTVFIGDGVIIYTEDDSEIAINFKNHLENDFQTLEIKVDLFDFIDMDISLYESLESVLYKYRYVFIINTENLNKDKVKARANEDLLYDSFQEEWKSGRIVPVLPFEGTKHCGLMFKSLKGIQFYKSKSTGQEKKLYEEGVEKFINRVRENSVKWEAVIKENKGKGIQS